MSASDEIDWGPAEQAVRWVAAGRLRDALAILPSLRRTGALVEDAVIDGDASTAAATVALIDDRDPQIAGRAAYLLGERAVRRGSASEVAQPLLEALRTALATAAGRILPLVAAVRECVRVGGAHDAAPELLAVVRRSALGELGELELMWAAEALIDLGRSAERIVDEAGALPPDVTERLRTSLEDIERGLRALDPSPRP